MNSERLVASDAVRRLQRRGYSAYFVGGCVRDKVLGLIPGDHDLATDAPLAVVEDVLCPISEGPPECGNNTYPVRKFKIGGYKIDVTTMLNGSLIDDANARDFTMNSMYEDPVRDQIIDPLKGQRDMARKVLVCVGDVAECMMENTRRIIRAPRFAAKLGYRIDGPIWRATPELAHLVKDIKADWLREECASLMTGVNPTLGVNFIRETGVVNYLPEDVVRMLGLSRILEVA